MTADRSRRRAGLLATPVALAAVGFGWLALRSAHPALAAGTAPIATGSAPVVRADLTSTVQVQGTLGYAGSYTIVNQAAGTAFTTLPAPGTTIRRDQPLYEVDGTPAWHRRTT